MKLIDNIFILLVNLMDINEKDKIINFYLKGWDFIGCYL